MSTEYYETEEEMDDAFENMMEQAQDEAKEREEEERASAVENTLLVEWHFHIECPKCGESLDISEGDHDESGCFSNRIFTHDWDAIKGMDVTCDGCEYEFKIHNVEPW